MLPTGGAGEENKVTEDARLIDITRYPDDETTTLNFNLKIFLGCDIKDSMLLHTDTIKIAERKITHYFKIEYCPPDIKDSSSITTAYSTIDKGLVAYQYLNGVWWIRQ